jgi:hypothetical protein
MSSKRKVVYKPLPLRRTSDRLVRDWLSYEAKVTVPNAPQNQRFVAELLNKTDNVALVEACQYGDDALQRECWKVIARRGNVEDLEGILLLTGPVPPIWMDDSYFLYDRELVKRAIIYNNLSKLEVPDITSYIEGYEAEGMYTTDSTMNPVLYSLVKDNPESLRDIPLEDVLLGCMDVKEGKILSIKSKLTEIDLARLSVVYNVEPELPGNLNSVLTMSSSNDLSQPNRFFNAQWINTWAPWLILTSPREMKLALFLFFECYRLELLYGTEEDREWLLERCDLTRVSLSVYYPRI